MICYCNEDLSLEFHHVKMFFMLYYDILNVSCTDKITDEKVKVLNNNVSRKLKV